MERRARAELRDRVTEESTDSAVRALYREQEHALMWVSADGLNRQGERLVEAISTVAAEGMNADAYGLHEARSALALAGEDERSPGERAQALAEAELALTLGFADLVRDLANGASRPADVLPAWRIKPQEEVADGLLARLAGGDAGPAELLEVVRPASAEYRHLRDVLRRLHAIRDAGGWPEVPDRRLSAGDDDEAVAALRARLSASVVEEERSAATAGWDRATYFDDGLDRALRSFQERHVLNADGELDTETVRALNVPVEERIRTVELNLERWRWMPRELGERVVFVNIPGYDVRLLENERTVLQMKVVVGRAAWPTPIFTDTMTHMIVHPYWNVPESILTEEILPSAREDERFFVANNYEVVDAEGRLVEGDIDLEDLEPETAGGLRVRQRPGAGNALGVVKFMFPNNENVYLHDTPAKSLFERASRALSHGCVRVERPLQLARFLMEWTDGDPERFDQALTEEENARIDLPHSVPVYLAYFTVTVSDDGAPRFLADPYGLDREMSDLILTTDASRLAAAAPNGRTANGD